VYVLLGNGDGTSAAVNYSVVTPSSVTSGDFNGEGSDLGPWANLYSHTVSVLLGLATASSSPPVSYGVGPNRARDNGTSTEYGKLDLATVNADNNASACFWVTATARFKQPSLRHGCQLFHPGGPECVTSGDFNSDGKLDLVTANYAAKTSAFLLDPDACPDARGRGHNPNKGRDDASASRRDVTRAT